MEEKLYLSKGCLLCSKKAVVWSGETSYDNIAAGFCKNHIADMKRVVEHNFVMDARASKGCLRLDEVWK